MFAYCLNNPIIMSDAKGTCSKFLWFRIDCGKASCETSKNYVEPKSINPIGTYDNDKGCVYIISPDQVEAFLIDLEPNAVVVVDLRNNTDDENYDQNIRIMNSYKITNSKHQKEIIEIILKYNQANPVTPGWHRTLDSMLTEWQAHNDGYSLSPLAKLFLERDIKDNCAHVDFNNADESLGYGDYYSK